MARTDDTPIEPNDEPSREEYLALYTLLHATTDLLDAMAGREMISVREEYRDASNAVAKARVEIRKTARTSKDAEQTAAEMSFCTPSRG